MHTSRIAQAVLPDRQVLLRGACNIENVAARSNYAFQQSFTHRVIVNQRVVLSVYFEGHALKNKRTREYPAVSTM
jgi:hypothetical protein